MYNHAPKDYKCPLCLIVNGKDNPEFFAKVADIFYKDDFLTAFIGGKWWEKNPGGTIIIPNKHFENLYDIDEEYGHKIFDFSKKLAIALKKVYGCDGVSTRQHNELAGNQEVWHYHFHVMPRWEGDELYKNHDKKRWTTAEERKPYVEKLRKYFEENE
ncbi:MAG: HIT domain-containing protein [Candidatus Levybacteria bacterium]|nr:HIT domain-containing protein [Candidatus Levybacteria bacterium]